MSDRVRTDSRAWLGIRLAELSVIKPLSTFCMIYILGAWAGWAYAIVIGGVWLSLFAHELGHVFVASRFGVETREIAIDYFAMIVHLDKVAYQRISRIKSALIAAAGVPAGIAFGLAYNVVFNLCVEGDGTWAIAKAVIVFQLINFMPFLSGTDGWRIVVEMFQKDIGFIKPRIMPLVAGILTCGVLVSLIRAI